MVMRMIVALVVAGAVCAHSPVAEGEVAIHEVSLAGVAFTPADLTVTVGDSVRWVWDDGFHNVESGVSGTHDGVFSSGNPTPVVGTTFEVIFDQTFLDANPRANNAYPYYCMPHVGVGMIGTITVAAAPIDGPWAVSGEDIFATNNGNVGIGTSAPGIKLHVAGSIVGIEPQGFAVAGVSETGMGILGVANPGGFAGAFLGDVLVAGTLIKSGGSFKIDHPLDPANRYLSHSFVESPDMMNVYNGNVTTGRRGTAWVTLPDYFDTLNSDVRYQLTVIGQFAQAIIAREVRGNRFLIRTDKPNVKVSWQVTGVRSDPWANENRIIVEEEKPDAERGTFLHPELYDQPDELQTLRQANDLSRAKAP